MGDFTDRIYKRKPEIPGKDLLKLRVMANVLPAMAMRQNGERVKRVGGVFVRSQSNMVDHYANLVELYYVNGMSACQEYYDTIINRKKVALEVSAREKWKLLPWYEKVWRWFVSVTSRRKK